MNRIYAFCRSGTLAEISRERPKKVRAVDVEQAAEYGREAARNGKSLSALRYTDKERAEAWERGYWEARLERR